MEKTVIDTLMGAFAQGLADKLKEIDPNIDFKFVNETLVFDKDGHDLKVRETCDRLSKIAPCDLAESLQAVLESSDPPDTTVYHDALINIASGFVLQAMWLAPEEFADILFEYYNRVFISDLQGHYQIIKKKKMMGIFHPSNAAEEEANANSPNGETDPSVAS